jgi:hypothetical protein
MMVRTADSTSALLGLWISDSDALARSSACTFGFIEMPFHDDCQGSLNPLDVTSAERFPMAGGLPLQPRQCVPRGQLTGQVQAWYQDLLEDRLNALRSFAGRRVSHNG